MEATGPDLKRRLRMELAAAMGAADLAPELDKRLVALEIFAGRIQEDDDPLRHRSSGSQTGTWCPDVPRKMLVVDYYSLSLGPIRVPRPPARWSFDSKCLKKWRARNDSNVRPSDS